MDEDQKSHPVLDRIIQIILIIGLYDLIELIFEDIILWMMIRRRRNRHRSDPRRTRNKQAQMQKGM